MNISKTCLYADQDSYADVLADMASGYLLFPKAWYCLPEVSPGAMLQGLVEHIETYCRLVDAASPWLQV